MGSWKLLVCGGNTGGSGVVSSQFLSVGGIRDQAFRTLKIKECFSCPDSHAKGPVANPQEPLDPFSSFRIRLSARTLRRQWGCQMSSERPKVLGFRSG
jgi:hypothetical protein